MARLGELGEWKGGGTPSKSNSAYWSDGIIPWVSPKDMKVDVITGSQDHITEAAIEGSAAKLIPTGSVLFVTRSGILAHTFPVARTLVPVTVNQDLRALTPAPGIHPGYVAWAARAFGGEILAKCSKDGTTVASVDTELLLNFPVPVAPEREQDRIVKEVESHLTRTNDAVATLDRVQLNLKRYRASLLKAAVQGRLVPTEAELARAAGRDYEPASVFLERNLVERRASSKRSRGKGPQQDSSSPDAKVLLELPEGWCWATVEQICSHVVDCPHSTPKWSDTGHVCVRTTQFLPGRLDLANTKFVSRATYDERIQRLRPEPGDILYSREGGILGIACQVPEAVELCLGQRMLLMRTAYPNYSSYLMHVLNSPFTVQRVRKLTGGSASPHLNVADIRGFPVPLPPVAETRRIIKEIDRIFSIIDMTQAVVAASQGKAERLRQSILKWAFEGRLVDQDPTDEPAATLLEHIKAQRGSDGCDMPKQARRKAQGATA